MAERKSVSRELASRYKRANRSKKTRILDEFTNITGYRRDYASFLLRNWGRKVYWRGNRVVFVGDFVRRPPRMAREVHRRYDDRFLRHLIAFWELLSHPCGKRLKPQLPELLAKSEQFGEMLVAGEDREKLICVSAASIDRLLGPARQKMQLKARCSTRPGALLKKDIPVRRSMDWDEDQLGFLEIDLVGHEGGNARGEHCFSLNAVDIKSGWTEMAAVKNKAQQWVFDALQELRKRIPFPLRGLDSDNGSEFINHHLVRYCMTENIVFTRSRPNHINDGCHVEQKNNVVIRAYVGYSRYDTEEQRLVLNELYSVLRLYLNFFQPQMKLISKERIGPRVIKRYDPPQTRYDQLTSPRFF